MNALVGSPALRRLYRGIDCRRKDVEASRQRTIQCVFTLAVAQNGDGDGLVSVRIYA